MQIEIMNTPLSLTLHGFGGTVTGSDYTGAAFAFSKKLWDTVKQHQIKNKGKNIWVYDANKFVFAGVELEDPSGSASAYLETSAYTLNCYASYTHVGPYQLIKQKGTEMSSQLTQMGYTVIPPYIEIYGHWNADENLLETTLLMQIRK